MASTEPHIIECTRCKAPQLFNFPSLDSMIPTALHVELDGGYAMFVDNIYTQENPLQYLLCHPCGHELTKFLGIPEPVVKNWHQKTDDPYCDGWTFAESMAKELELLRQKLSDLIYMNEHTMIEPFEDYPRKRQQIEELIAMQEERLT